MEQWLRDALAEEQGYVICPLAFETYIHCDEKCDDCDLYKDFKESLERRYMEENLKELREMINNDINSVGGIEGFNNYPCANEVIASWIDRILDIIEEVGKKNG